MRLLKPAAHSALLLAASLVTSLPSSAQTPVTINVDSAANRHVINPNVYGVAFSGATALSALNVPLNRVAGEHLSRYNWKQNAYNSNLNWFFESVYAGGGNGPGAYFDSFIAASKSAGSQSTVTIPMLDWGAKLGPNGSTLWSYSQNKYGWQQNADYSYIFDAGNGTTWDGRPITWNDPNDANTPVDSTFQQDWVRYLVGKWGNSNNGGVRYYFLDNEPSIWYNLHRDVHPNGASMDEVRDRIVNYSAKIKAIDPDALTAGPDEWGWLGYIYDGVDQKAGNSNGWSYFPSRAAHGNMDYLPWLLNALHTADASRQNRSLDIFSVHYFPQGGEFSDDVSSGMQLLRNRSTRALWDPNYLNESWIYDYVNLIPRLKGWVNQYYPGLQTAITEYNWGAENHINGATTQADVLGIFGRENLDMAARWTTPGPSTPTFKAFQMYRNYDGNKSTFGDVSVKTTVPDPDTVSAFASTRKNDNALTVMVINKDLTDSASLRLNLTNAPQNATALTYQLTSANVITRLTDVSVVNGTLRTTLPAQSVTLFVVAVPPAVPLNLAATGANNAVNLTWNAVSGASGYNIKRSLVSGGPYQTIAANISETTYSDIQATNGQALYYIVTAVNAGIEGLSSNETRAVPNGPVAPPLRINAAGNSFTSPTGTVWQKDTYFSGGDTWGWTGAPGNPDDILYASVRYSGTTFTYNLPARVGAYTLRLLYSEGVGSSVTAPGQRLFDVSANGNLLVHNYDVVGLAGGQGKPISASYSVQSDGSGIKVTFTATKSNAMVSALELTPSTAAPLPVPSAPSNLKATGADSQVTLTWNAATNATTYTVKRAAVSGGPYTTVASSLISTGYADLTVTNGTTYYYIVTATNGTGESTPSNEASATPNLPPPPSLRVDCGGGPYSNGTTTFSSDRYFNGGAIWTWDIASSTPDAPLYRTVRYGNFSYNMPAGPGKYTLKLYFADGTGSGALGPGQRLFNVSANGVPLATNLDVVAEAGGAGLPLIKTYNITNTSSSVQITFTSVKFNAMVSAIELIPVP